MSALVSLICNFVHVILGYGVGVPSVSKVVSPYHGVAAPVYGGYGYGGYGGYGVSKIATLGMYVVYLKIRNQIIIL